VARFDDTGYPGAFARDSHINIVDHARKALALAVLLEILIDDQQNIEEDAASAVARVSRGLYIDVKGYPEYVALTTFADASDIADNLDRRIRELAQCKIAYRVMFATTWTQDA
jgi:hypothetical protein